MYSRSHLLNVRCYHNLIDLYAYAVPSQYSSLKLVAIGIVCLSVLCTYVVHCWSRSLQIQSWVNQNFLYNPGEDAASTPYMEMAYKSLRTNTPLVMKIDPQDSGKVHIWICIRMYMHCSVIYICTYVCTYVCTYIHTYVSHCVSAIMLCTCVSSNVFLYWCCAVLCSFQLGICRCACVQYTVSLNACVGVGVCVGGRVCVYLYLLDANITV